MPKPADFRFKLYKFALRLYPKSFRSDYSDQMIQTLSDMLDDQPDAHGRSSVWLRIAFDTPVSIVQQNSTSLRGTIMDKISMVSNKKLQLAAGGGALLAVIAASAVLIRWAPSEAIANVAGVFYKHGLQQTIEVQNNALKDPYGSIMGKQPRTDYVCSPSATSGIKMQVSCQSIYQAYALLSKGDADKAKNLEAAKSVEQALKAQGYEGGSNGVTLSSLVSGIYEGKDYTPDAFYQKVVGKSHCVFDTQIAYANPNPPAINMMLTCDRTFNIVGEPSNVPYRSTENYK